MTQTNSISRSTSDPRALAATRKFWISRSQYEDTQRCKRLRWWGYHAGSQGIGLSPKKKSIHLVIGGAVHAGLEVLLREGQEWLNKIGSDLVVEVVNASGPQMASLDYQLDVMFGKRMVSPGITTSRLIEDRAVTAALAELSAMTSHGVKLDDLEEEGAKKLVEQQAAGAGVGLVGNVGLSGDSAIMLDFEITPGSQAANFQFDLRNAASTTIIQEMTYEKAREVTDRIDRTVVGGQSPTLREKLEASLVLEDQKEKSANLTSDLDWGSPVYLDENKTAAASPSNSDSDSSTDSTILDFSSSLSMSDLALTLPKSLTEHDDYLQEELASLVEAMVRAYARRRLRPLLTDFEVLETEREGAWKLGDVDGEKEWYCRLCPWVGPAPLIKHGNEFCPECYPKLAHDVEGPNGFAYSRLAPAEVWFASRHDALLLERSTGFIYIQSYKTTGSWDRRKENDAQVDMQGLSEAVDVENRLQEAWRLLHDDTIGGIDRRLANIVTDRTAEWIKSQPEPPRVLGVRYEYLLKGQRRQDKKDPDLPGRYVTDTPLIRAWRQDGITADDRRWAWTFDWHELTGKGRRLDYRSWQKSPVWRFMPVAQWIDLLDTGEVQADAYDANGNGYDPLGEQFVPVVTVYRNDDDMRDMLEQLEASEVKVAQDLIQMELVKDKPAEFRSELNKRFPQSRKSCSYPSKCSSWILCYGTAAERADPENNGHYEIRTYNHPQEAN